MDLSINLLRGRIAADAFLGLLLAVALLRLVELRISKRHQKEMVARGAAKIDEPKFSGPFRYVRHPNYAAVFAEMLALPLIHTAWITAAAGAIAHIGVLAQRLSTEERVLFANPDYRAAMTGKPRFLPGLF